MKKEDKELLLKDLSARTPYKVVAQVTYKDSEGWKTGDRKVLGAYADGQVYVDCVYTNIENVKPYLRSLSSMTEEERKEYTSLCNRQDIDTPTWSKIIWHDTYKSIDWLNKKMFDYRNLIPKGLALEAPEEMYDKE